MKHALLNEALPNAENGIDRKWLHARGILRSTSLP